MLDRFVIARPKCERLVRSRIFTLGLCTLLCLDKLVAEYFFNKLEPQYVRCTVCQVEQMWVVLHQPKRVGEIISYCVCKDGNGEH